MLSIILTDFQRSELKEEKEKGKGKGLQRSTMTIVVSGIRILDDWRALEINF